MSAGFDPRDRIETHEAILARRPFVSSILTNELTVDAKRTWMVEERWHRGSLRAALEAPSSEDADRFIETFLRGNLPEIPFPAGPGVLHPFWLELAKANSRPRSGIWRKGHPLPRRCKIENSIDAALSADLIFELPHFPVSDEELQSPFVYFRDSGLLRVLLNKEAQRRKTSLQNEFLDDPPLNAIRPKTWRRKAKEFWWEGFVIDAIRTLSMPLAQAYYWRRDDDEIDLVLSWSNGERWGVEITHGDPRKKPGDGFFRAAQQIGLGDRFVVGRNGDTRGRQDIPCFDLVGALQRVMDGIARCSSGGR